MPFVVHESYWKSKFPPCEGAKILITRTGRSAVFEFKSDKENEIDVTKEGQKIVQIELSPEMIESLKKSKCSGSIC